MAGQITKRLHFSRLRISEFGFLLLIAILWAIGGADFYLTIWARQFTPFVELNPFAARLLDAHGFANLAMLKLLLTITASWIFWHFRQYREVRVGVWMIVTVYMLLAFRWANYTRDAITKSDVQSMALMSAR
jgi:hypothetical protein